MAHIINFRDIAREAGVSPATVSLALRGARKIPEATRARVIACAERLGYRPNPLVSAFMASLRAGRRKETSGILAVITERPLNDYARTHPGIGLIVEGARTQAAEAGYVIDEFAVKRYAEEHRDMEQTLRARNITGLLLLSLTDLGMKLKLDWSRYAVCMAGGLQSPHHFMWVHHDYFQIMVCGVENLRRLGYGRIGLVMSDILCLVTEHRFEAAWLYLQEKYGMESLVPMLRAGRQPRLVFLEWVRRHRPEAIIATDHRVLGWLKAEGIRVPEDMAVAHTDIAPGWGPLAGVDQCHRRAGAAVVEQLIFQCDHNHRGPLDGSRTLLVSGEWRDGATAPAVP
ncbi:MAG: LacI family transcriptional regulator [Opitutaceae bacterium]|nr:LacI family transcriptional regulator [Opitutaceae bacterium]